MLDSSKQRVLDAVEQDYGCTVAGSVLVGDSMKDIELARRKHCRPVLVRSGNGAKTLASPGSAGALEGLTQDTVMNIAEDLGIECHVTDLTRSDLYVCDEMFVCGTAAEVSAVNSVDDRDIPCPGPMTTAIASEYAKVVRGQVDRYKDWVELVS